MWGGGGFKRRLAGVWRVKHLLPGVVILFCECYGLAPYITRPCLDRAGVYLILVNVKTEQAVRARGLLAVIGFLEGNMTRWLLDSWKGI